MELANVDLTQPEWTPEALDALRVKVLTELERRAAIANAAPSVRDTIVGFMKATGASKEDVEVIAANVLATIPDRIEE